MDGLPNFAEEQPTEKIHHPVFTFDLNSDMHMQMIHKVKIGVPFYAKGAENPTTGFTWNAVIDPAGSIKMESDYK